MSCGAPGHTRQKKRTAHHWSMVPPSSYVKTIETEWSFHSSSALSMEQKRILHGETAGSIKTWGFLRGELNLGYAVRPRMPTPVEIIAAACSAASSMLNAIRAAVVA